MKNDEPQPEIKPTAIQLIEEGVSQIVLGLVFPNPGVKPTMAASDCDNLRKLIATLQQALFDLCETCQPVEINPDDSGINL